MSFVAVSLPRCMVAVRGTHFAHRNRISRANFSSLPQPELSRVVRLLHRQRVRSSPRARVQRHSQRGALIDISPLYKYLITGKDATRLVNRVITRDINKVKVGQVIYCCWCDEEGKVIDDGTISRLEENVYRWTAADPSLRWFRQNGLNMDVQIEDISEKVAALALQGPTSAKLLKAVAEADIANLKYFRVTRGKIAGVPVDISRTGYTGDLGYEIWIPWNDAVKVWDALADKGKQFDLHAAGMLALDVSRVEAGLAADRSRLHEFEEGADSVAEVFALRAGLRQDGSSRQRKLHRQNARSSKTRRTACRAN